MSWKGKAVCFGCRMHLQAPYIKCVECATVLCLNCFAQGYETPVHHNHHAYEVISLDFCLFDNTWTASDEMTLLDSIAECGVGNWTDIACRMRNKTEEECEAHYLDYYINYPQKPLQNIMENIAPKVPTHNWYRMIPYEASDEPPRPKDDPGQAVDMAYYMPCRGDFNVEYDNFAECDIKDVEFDYEDRSDDELKVAAADIYLSRVKERCFRKRIIKDYGLINVRKTELTERNLPKVEKDLRDRLKPFAKLHTAEKHEQFIQGLLLEDCLKQEIRELQHYRTAGLTLKDSIKLYQLSHQDRMKYISKGSMMDDLISLLDNKVACQSWLQRQAALSQSSAAIAPFPIPSLGRKPATRLDISGTPGVERLTEEERELCSNLRLLPHAYLEYKQMLIKENQLLGSLKLAQARSLIKIDVNKTRKLYDFCVRHNLINRCDN